MSKKSPTPNPQAPASLSVGLSSSDAPAKRELSRHDEELETAPESKRWDMVPGSSGKQAPEIPSEDDDAEGRSEAEQLVDDGAEKAAREQAARAGAKKHS